MKVLVTGPTGAAGQYVLETLMTTGHSVRALALPDTLHRVNFRDRIEIVPGELSDQIALREAVKGVEVVFHTALISPPPVLTSETLSVVNIAGTRALLAACADTVRRFVLVSSAAVHAPHLSPAMWPVSDDALRMAHGNPQQTALGESLIAAEDIVLEAAARGRIEHTILRPTAVAGRNSSFVMAMISSIMQNPGNLEVGHRMWDMMQWVHGSDIGRAALLVADHAAARNQCMLVAGAEPVTVYDVQKLMWDVMNPGRSGNPFAGIAACNNIGLPKFEPRKLRALGWSPLVSVKQCIAEVLSRLEFDSSASLKMPAHLLDE